MRWNGMEMSSSADDRICPGLLPNPGQFTTAVLGTRKRFRDVFGESGVEAPLALTVVNDPPPT